MTKSLIMINYLNFIYPMMLNILILFLMIIPIKFNKFHPIKLILILISLTFFISMKMNILFKSWMNFYILLIMIGGLMVIFLYITSLNNNTLMNFKFKNIIKNFIKFTFLSFIFFIMFEFNLLNLNNQDLWNLNLNIYEEKNNISLMKLFNINKLPMIFIMLYLYFSLICIMNICYKMKNPLRQINI